MTRRANSKEWIGNNKEEIGRVRDLSEGWLGLTFFVGSLHVGDLNINLNVKIYDFNSNKKLKIKSGGNNENSLVRNSSLLKKIYKNLSQKKMFEKTKNIFQN